MTFQQDIGDFVRKTGIRKELVLRKLALEMFTGLLLRSPVLTGRFRGEWRLSVNRRVLDLNKAPKKLSLATRKRRKTTVGKAVTSAERARFGATLARAKFGDTIFITNNLPYAKSLNSGSSMQAPADMVGRTFQDVTSRFAEVVAQVRQQVV